MDETTCQVLEQAGIDMESANDRFLGNMELLIKFLKKFPGDPNYQALHQALGQEDWEQAEYASHTLKGLCGNLSMIKLYQLFTEQVDLLRGKKYEEAVALMESIDEEYRRISKVIENCAQ